MPALPISKLLLIPITLFGLSFTASALDNRSEWLQQNTTRLSSIDPLDANFSEFQAIGDAIGNKDIVMLGEATHTDGATFSAKIRLVKYLVEVKGFKVIAFESGMFDVRKVNEAIAQGSDAVTAAREGVISKWSEVDDLIPLFKYLAQKKVKLVGFDGQFTGTASRQKLAPELKSFLHQIDQSVSDSFLETLQHLANKDYIKGIESPLTASETEIFLSELEGISRHLSLQPKQESVEFWKSFLSNLKQSLQVHLTPLGPDLDPMAPTVLKLLNLRDRVMADNLKWQIEQAAGEKVMVWAASWHILRNPGKISGVFQPDIMGDALWKDYSSRMYSIAFTAYEGTWGAKNELVLNIEKDQIANVDELEELFSQTNLNHGFLDFSHLPKEHWLKTEETYMRPLGYRASKAIWPDVFDAIIFHREMYPITKSQIN